MSTDQKQCDGSGTYIEAFDCGSAIEHIERPCPGCDHPDCPNEQILTLPEIARRTGGEYRTLFNWRNRGILTPSVQQANGSGTRDLFSQRDLQVVATLIELRKHGLDIEGVAAVAKLLAEHDRVLCPVCDSKPINLATLDHKGDTDG